MAAKTITYEDPNSPGDPGISRTYADDSKKVTSDHGCVPVADLQVGWRTCRPKESWLKIHAITTPE